MSNRRAVKPTRGTPEDHLVRATERLLTAVEKFSVSAQTYIDTSGAIQLPELLSSLSDPYAVAREVADLTDAVAIVNDGIPVAGADANGIRWGKSLTPRSIMFYAARSQTDDVGYSEQLAVNIEHATNKKNQWRTVLCGRKNDCRLARSYWPGRTPEDSPACSIHMTDDEAAELIAIYKEAVSKRVCEGCGAVAGQQCIEEGPTLVTVDGRWPNLRTF